MTILKDLQVFYFLINKFFKIVVYNYLTYGTTEILPFSFVSEILGLMLFKYLKTALCVRVAALHSEDPLKVYFLYSLSLQ